MADLRLKTHKANGCITITIPKEVCNRYNIKGIDGEYIDVMIHQIIKKDKKINIAKVEYRYVYVDE